MSKSATSDTDNKVMYRTVATELKPLQEAAENTNSSKWALIKDRAAKSGMFVAKSVK